MQNLISLLAACRTMGTISMLLCSTAWTLISTWPARSSPAWPQPPQCTDLRTSAQLPQRRLLRWLPPWRLRRAVFAAAQRVLWPEPARGQYELLVIEELRVRQR